jgi:hypothetical protein
MIYETVVKIFSTRMGITRSGLYFENTLLNCKKQYIESSSIKIEDENVTFTASLLVETFVVREGDRGPWLLAMISTLSSRPTSTQLKK